MTNYVKLFENRNYLNIWDYLQLIGVNPEWYGYNFCAGTNLDAPTLGCGCNRECIASRNYLNSDWLGADDIYDAVDRAFNLLTDWLGFSILPAYYREEIIYDRQKLSLLNIYGDYKQFTTGLGHVISLGKPILSEEVAAQILWITSPSNDPQNNFSINGRFFQFDYTTTNDPTRDEFILAHTAANRDGEPLEDWMLDNVVISIVGIDTNMDGQDDTWTITFKGVTAQLFDPEYALTGDCCTQADITMCYINQLSIYRITQDPCQIGEFEWRGKNGCLKPCTTETHHFCGTILDSRRGKFQPIPKECCTDNEGNIIINPDTGLPTFCSYCLQNMPDKMFIWYRSGHPLTSHATVQRKFKQALAYLATGMLYCDMPYCSPCDDSDGSCLYSRVKKFKEEYRFKLQEGDQKGMLGDIYRLGMTSTQLENFPFPDITFGSVEAYKLMKRYKLGDR